MIEYIYRGTRDRSFGRRPICGFLKVFAVPHHGPTHTYWFSELRKINFDEYMIGNICTGIRSHWFFSRPICSWFFCRPTIFFTGIRGHWFFSRPICSWFFCRPTHPGRGDEMTWVLNKFHAADHKRTCSFFSQVKMGLFLFTVYKPHDNESFSKVCCIACMKQKSVFYTFVWQDLNEERWS